MTMVLLSFRANIEIEACMLWPGLMVLGIHASEMYRDRLAKGALKAPRPESCNQGYVMH